MHGVLVASSSGLSTNTCLRVCNTPRIPALQTSLAPARIQAWEQVQPASDLGQDCSTYKWSQTQTEISVFVQLPEHLRRHEVRPTPFGSALDPTAFSNRLQGGLHMPSRWLWS